MIELHDLSKSFGNTLLFDHINYRFPTHGIVCVLGASGCGKSTLLNLLAGFDGNYAGHITVGDVNLQELEKDALCAYRRDEIGFVFQDYHLLHGFSVLENVLISSPLRQTTREYEVKRAIEILDKVGLKEKQQQKVENLSGGQKQRVAIARALMGDPSILLADEVTGALDRKNSIEIMNLLKDISQTKLVILVTHDKQLCSFADEIITMQDCHIIPMKKSSLKDISYPKKDLQPNHKVSIWNRSIQNFKVRCKRYGSISLAISLGVICCILSLSFGNMTNQSIQEFKEKNTAFNNGYIESKNDNLEEIQTILQNDERISTVFMQYKIQDIKIRYLDKEEYIQEKCPTAKATQSMSYGVMPQYGQNQIALSPSLAKKVMTNFNELIGKEIILNYHGQDYTLVVSGIFNYDFDDFLVSSDIEQLFYQNIQNEGYSISYDVKNFEDIIPVHEMIKDNGFDSKDAIQEVEAFQRTFQSVQRLFLIVSGLIFIICILIAMILLGKLQRSRYKEIGLLSALGFRKRSIRNMIIIENFLLAMTAISFNVLWTFIIIVVSRMLDFTFSISISQIGISMFVTFFVVEIISIYASHKLLHLDPALALKS